MIEEILKTFKDLTPILWVSQICGLIGFVITLISFQFKKTSYFIISSVALVFFSLEQIFAGLYSNLVVTLVSLVRSIVLLIFLFKGKDKAPDYIIYILLGIIWTFEIILFIVTKTLNKLDNYLPPVLVSVAILASNNKNYYILKLGALFGELGFLIYYIIYRLPFTVIREIAIVISIVISIIIMLIADYKRKRKIL